MTDHKTERNNDFEKIKNSKHPRRVVVAGPGAGKSYLFSELIKKKKSEGKTNFIAITFVGKLGDALADDLCGLAETTTMHGFARRLVLKEAGKGWVYYPGIVEIIKEDLEKQGIKNSKIGDVNYRKRTAHYKAVGDDDVGYYAVEICRKDVNKIPRYDLVLVDEFQDFNSLESEFVDELARKNEIVIVGDDDQALYGFKGASPEFIRQKYDPANKDWESHSLRFCSRCTEVIIKSFHSLVKKYDLNRSKETHVEKKRVEKDYICYVPDKHHDSKENPKIVLMKGCPPGMIAYKVSSVLEQLTRNQKIKDVLVIGEAQSCKSILADAARMLSDYGFRYVTHLPANPIELSVPTLDAYGMISRDEGSALGWRLLGDPANEEKAAHLKAAKTLDSVLKKREIADSSIQKLLAKVIQSAPSDSTIKNELAIKDIRQHFRNLPRPLANIEITVCSTLSSKGLGADVVFMVGFDQGRFPREAVPTNSEIYQMLVAITRAKKRLYLINTVGKAISSFAGGIDSADLEVEEI